MALRSEAAVGTTLGQNGQNPGAARPQGSVFLGVTDESLSRFGVFN